MDPPTTGDHQRPSGREIFEASLSGAQSRPFIPPLKSDPPYQPLPHSLLEFRQQEGAVERERRLRQLWLKLPKRHHLGHEGEAEETANEFPVQSDSSLTLEGAMRLKEMYETELLGRCGGHTSGFTRRHIGWKEFQKYAEGKEAGVHVFRPSFWPTIQFSQPLCIELWHIFHDELDLDGNGHLDAEELAAALQNAGRFIVLLALPMLKTFEGIKLSPSTLAEFMTFLTSSPHSHAIGFQEFRDFLLLMPRRASTAEIFRYYELNKFMGDDGRGAARVNMEGQDMRRSHA